MKKNDHQKFVKNIEIGFLALLIALFLLLNTFNSIALDSSYYQMRFLEIAPSTYDGYTYTEDQLTEIASTITGYLDGQKDSMDISIQINSEPYKVFMERELAHMRDVRELFDLQKGVLFSITAMLLIMFLMLGRDLKAIGLALVIAPLINALVGIASLLVDFSKAFIVFHEILFTNDLWLLDPSKENLIRMMPLEFFAGFLSDWIGLISITSVVSILIGAFMLYRVRRQAKNSEVQG